MVDEEKNLVELSDEEGNVTNCEIYDIVEFEDKTYAMLLPVDSDEEEPELIVLEYVEEGEEGTFVSIEDEDEFNRVCDYIESLMDEVEE
jgi:putative Holliday junction resolvase